MKRWRSRFLFLAGAAVLVSAIPASSQDAPESLLPPGFGDPESLPPAQKEAPAPASDPGSMRPSPPTVRQVDPETLIENASEDELEALLGLDRPKRDDLPEWARRSTALVGPLGPSNTGMAPAAFGNAHGRFLATLMQRLDAPIPSRWTSIVLRRALLSHVPAPYAVAPVDWVAERAALLLRMGEADGARLLVQAVDVENFTPKMMDVALETALATADPAGLCPLIDPGRAVSQRPMWPLAEAMCAALEGEASRASALIDQERRHGGAGSIDLLLAEKVIGAGANTRRAVTIEWNPVDRLDSWRFGLASATGLAVPDRLFDTVGPQMRAWQARAAMLPIEERLFASDVAATLGVFSNASLVEIYSLIADATDPADMRDSVAERLRDAYVGRNVDARIDALHKLWDDADTPLRQYARMVLTAAAAARIAPSDQLEGDAPRLITAMLSAGFDRQAARWAEVVDGMDGNDADRAWALLALASPQPNVDLSPSRIGDFAGRDGSPEAVRTKMLVAALAGLGRIPQADRDDVAGDYGVQLDRTSRWTAMIASAAERRQPATVALLAGVGMQTGDWRGVPPEHLYHILRALRLVGMDYEARMIGAEALSRL